MSGIDEKIFEEMLKDKLPSGCYERALAAFRNYGKLLSVDVFNILLWAVNCCPHKFIEVLGALEEHWENDLQYQAPEIRGTVRDQAKLLRICKEILGMEFVQSTPN